TDRDPAIADLLVRLSRTRYEQSLDTIAALATRHSLSPEFRAMASATAEQLRAMGYSVRQPAITMPGGSSENVVAEQVGTGVGPRGLVIVTAHLDSVNQAGRELPAPGADDNASGAAGLLELAHVVSTEPWPNDVRFILFGGEEQGLLGSKSYVDALEGIERHRLRAVINMDMIARRNGPTPGVLIEGASVSRDLIDRLVTSAATWTRLEVSTSLQPYASDHVPFIDAGLPAVLTIEANDTANTDVHSDRDVLDKLDAALAMEILRMNLAALADMLAQP
ncbi:MAG: Zn-dependent exopeptidase M28, partial [Aldersonia sp.]|nr:Zn-dependent exopeptidase M28 [Aldersonia sp.]